MIEVLALMLAPPSRSPQISPGHKKQAASWIEVDRRLHLGPVKELVCRKGRIEVDLRCRESSLAWA